MVLKRKLPTQESKQNNKDIEQESQLDNFDMSIETDESAKKVAKKGHDLNDDFPDGFEDKPDDFIPAELRALEGDSLDSAIKTEEVSKKETAAEVTKQENEEIMPVSFDSDDEFSTVIDEHKNTDSLVKEESNDFNKIESPFEKAETAPQPKMAIQETEENPFDDFDMNASQPKEQEPIAAVDFDTPEPANWSEIVPDQTDSADSFDSLETPEWNDTASVEVKSTVTDSRFEEPMSAPVDDFSFGQSDNGGVIPEIPGLDTFDSKPADVMANSKSDLSLNSEAKKKAITGAVLGALAIGAYVVYTNMDKATETTNRWAGSLTAAPQDIAETEQEQKELLEQGKDITKPDEVIDFEDFSVDGSKPVSNTDISLLDDEFSEDDKSTTEIDLLDPQVIEKTASGKEIIRADGDEEMPKKVAEGANLLNTITAEIEKQKANKIDGADELSTDESESEVKKDEFKGAAADVNKKVEDQLAEYRKLLAEEGDPGKKVKPGAFFSGKYKEEEAMPKSSVKVAKVDLENIETNKLGDSNAIGGHNIIEYPKGVARKNNDGIRTLDHFRTLLVEKEDKRVRMPKHLKPALRNQGFPTFKVISIVPNYGLIGEYNSKKGILMIGDSFKGWELIGVYESYAEFKSDTRKHIISLK